MSRRKLTIYAITVPVSLASILLGGCYILVRSWTDPKGRLDDVEDYFDHLALLPALMREAMAA